MVELHAGLLRIPVQRRLRYRGSPAGALDGPVPSMSAPRGVLCGVVAVSEAAKHGFNLKPAP
jgi:hypothetical protein